jgi:hypothetical protein
MIVFDLRCDGGHVFEAWFASSDAYARQREDGLLSCPVCASASIGKAVMAPAVAAKGNRAVANMPDAAAMKQAIGRLAAEQAKLLASSQWVGRGFAQQARAMHDGEEPQRTIHGQATLAEAKALVDDGIPVAPLPLPIVPPDQVN